MTNRTRIGITAALIALCALIAAAVFPGSRLVSLPVAMIALLVPASMFSAAGKLSTELANLKGRTVSVQLWGAAPEGDAAATFRLHSVRAIGPGLHLWLERASGGAPTHLKIAQPAGASWAAGEFRISAAKYVQWAGRTVARREGMAALTLKPDA